MIRAVIDLHAHILPGLDDGPPTLDAAVEMAAATVEAGTRVMAATSHINRGFGLRAAELAEARAVLNERLRAEAIPLEVVQGGEISLARLDGLDDDELRGLTLGDGPWLLLECPLSPSAPSLEPAVAALRNRGFEILLAHPERSPNLMRGPEPLGRLVELGALAQVTSGSFAGEFGDVVRRAAFAMLEAGLVHVLSTDAHSAYHRPPDLRPALAALDRRYSEGAEEQYEWMTTDAPGALLAAAPLPERPELPRARGGLLRRLKGG